MNKILDYIDARIDSCNSMLDGYEKQGRKDICELYYARLSELAMLRGLIENGRMDKDSDSNMRGR